MMMGGIMGKEKPRVLNPTFAISRRKIFNLLKAGHTYAETAKKLGCSSKTICNVVKEKKWVFAQGVTLGEKTSASLLKTNVNTLEQLNEVNASLLEELEVIRREIQDADLVDEDGKLLEPIKDIRENKKVLRTSNIQYMAELRKQHKLLLEIYRTTFEIGQVHKFQTVVMNKIKELAPETAKQIIQELRVEQFVSKEITI